MLPDVWHVRSVAGMASSDGAIDGVGNIWYRIQSIWPRSQIRYSRLEEGWEESRLQCLARAGGRESVEPSTYTTIVGSFGTL